MPEGEEIQALRSRILKSARDIIDGTQPPTEAARELDGIRTNLVHLEVAFRPFAGLAGKWDYDPDRRFDIEREILSAAESLRRSLER